jgi:hypothetical protein
VVLACLAVAAYGWGVVRAGLFPAWVGWGAIGWSGLWMTLYLAETVTAPLGVNLVTLLFGICLLRSPAGAGEPRQGVR